MPDNCKTTDGHHFYRCVICAAVMDTPLSGLLEVPREEPSQPTEAALETAWNAWRENGNIGYPLNEGTRHSAFEGGWSAAGVEVRALRKALWCSATDRHYMHHTNQLPDAAFTDFGICTFAACTAARALVPEPPKNTSG